MFKYTQRTFSLGSNLSTIASGSGDNSVKVWNVENENCINTLTGHTSSAVSITMTSDRSKIISGSADKRVKIWSLHTGQCLNTFKRHTKAVHIVAISSDQTNILREFKMNIP